MRRAHPGTRPPPDPGCLTLALTLHPTPAVSPWLSPSTDPGCLTLALIPLHPTPAVSPLSLIHI
eukprot:304188-Prymnesium_polylepis.1